MSIDDEKEARGGGNNSTKKIWTQGGIYRGHRFNFSSVRLCSTNQNNVKPMFGTALFRVASRTGSAHLLQDSERHKHRIACVIESEVREEQSIDGALAKFSSIRVRCDIRCSRKDLMVVYHGRLHQSLFQNFQTGRKTSENSLCRKNVDRPRERQTTALPPGKPCCLDPLSTFSFIHHLS